MRGLIVVDVQNDFMPGGALAVPGSIHVPRACNELMAAERYPVVILTQDWHPADHRSFASQWKVPEFSTKAMPYGPQVMWPDHCIAGHQGAEFSPYLDTDFAHLVIRKGFDPLVDSYSAFEDAAGKNTGLAQYLHGRGVNELDVVGLATDFCVAATAVHARARGYHVRVLKSRCAAIDKDHSLAHAVVNMHAHGVRIE